MSPRRSTTPADRRRRSPTALAVGALALALALALAGCGERVTPAGSDAGSDAGSGSAPAPAGRVAARVVTDLSYADPVPADTQGHLLDLYLPEHEAGVAVPLFLFSEGSGWRADTGKVSAGTWAARLNPRGYAVAGVSVRSSDQVVFPGQLHDIKAAIRFLRDRAGDYDLAPDRFALGGFSSGGWMAALAGVANDVGPDLEGTTGTTGVSSRVQAVVTFEPPTAMALLDEQATRYTDGAHAVPDSDETVVLGCTQYRTGLADPRCTAAQRADPRAYVTPDDPPYLMLHTVRDPFVPPGQSDVLAERLRQDCVPVEYHLVDGPGHEYDSFLANPGPPRVTGQEVTTSGFAPEPGSAPDCAVTTTDTLTPANTPSYDLVASFLDRTIGAGVDLPVVPAPRAATSTTLRARPARRVRRGDALRLVATVTRSGLTSGTDVRFRDGRRVRGTAVVRRSGTAVLRLPRGLSVGRHRVRAVFVGNQRARASRSAVVRVRVRA